MSTAEMIAEQVKRLSPERQRDVLNLVRLFSQETSPHPRHDPYGLLRGQTDISEEEIAEARREMWGKFPHEDV